GDGGDGREDGLVGRRAHDAVEALLDHPQREEVVALLLEDPTQAFDVGLVELPVARRRALGVEQPLALEEADLRDGDVRELLLQEREDLTDRQMGALGHRPPAAPYWLGPAKNASLNFPIWSSSPLAMGPSSTRSRLREVPFSEP